MTVAANQYSATKAITSNLPVIPPINALATPMMVNNTDIIPFLNCSHIISDSVKKEIPLYSQLVLASVNAGYLSYTDLGCIVSTHNPLDELKVLGNKALSIFSDELEQIYLSITGSETPHYHFILDCYIPELLDNRALKQDNNDFSSLELKCDDINIIHICQLYEAEISVQFTVYSLITLIDDVLIPTTLTHECRTPDFRYDLCVMKTFAAIKKKDC